ncbi:MAG: M20/M25/M40 family metallo-hydrolase [Ruminococcus sp.]|jgi:endoglucanase|nr:M20/M25/M40 family metallo-hydrolase [Ruminococcus sp.]
MSSLTTAEILNKLTAVSGVSGDETIVTETILDIIGNENIHIIKNDTDLLLSVGETIPDRKNILIDAHIDRIGFVVTAVTDSGFLKVGNIGGIDSRILSAAEVTICTKSGEIPGVIAVKPPHLSSKDDKPLKISDLVIDTGMSGETAKREIAQGDRVYFKNTAVTMQNGIITASALDNRAGVAAAIAVLLKLKETPSVKANYYFLFSSQEESTERGAKIVASMIDFDESYVIDTSFAYFDGEPKDKCGIMGKGVMLGISSTLDKGLFNEISNECEAANEPFQVEVMPEKTGTNADVIGGTGARCITLSIPIKYMHTPVETVEIADIESTVRVLVNHLGKENA